MSSIGADDVIGYTTGDFAEGAARYDAILDVGGNTPLACLRRVLAPKGVLVFVGGENGGGWTAGFGRQLEAGKVRGKVAITVAGAVELR